MPKTSGTVYPYTYLLVGDRITHICFQLISLLCKGFYSWFSCIWCFRLIDFAVQQCHGTGNERSFKGNKLKVLCLLFDESLKLLLLLIPPEYWLIRNTMDKLIYEMNYIYDSFHKSFCPLIRSSQEHFEPTNGLLPHVWLHSSVG